MNNVGSRERRLVLVFGIILICAILYIFPIRMLRNSTVELKAQREALQAQKDYYDALASQNEATRAEIEDIENDIAELEATFLPEINTECIEQWVQSVFEDNGCPYLVKIESADAIVPDIVLPDGTLSEDNIVKKSITVQYSTTDGWNVPAYGSDTAREGTIYINGVPDQGAFDANMNERTYTGMYSRVGYDEFLASLEVIEGTNEQCIKVSDIKVESKSGYILMSATIDFYGATFVDRVSEPSTNAPYITWSGMTGIDTSHGFIGKPFYVDDAGSEWYGTIMNDSDASDRERPFAAYYSAQTWANLVEETDTATALGLNADNPFGQGVAEGAIPSDDQDNADNDGGDDVDNGDNGEGTDN